MAQYDKKLSLKEKIGYGFGDFGNGFMFDLGQLYLLKFYTDVFGLKAYVAGLVFLVSKLADAFIDSAVGAYIDSQSKISKYGKFRPFILFGTIPLGIITIITFLSPNLPYTGKVIWAFATYILFNAAYSIVNIPYGSLASSMTQDSVQRTELSSYRGAGYTASLLVTGMFLIPGISKFSDPHIGYPIMVTAMCVAGVICHLICFKFTKENVVVVKKEGQKVSFGKVYKSLLTNRALIGMVLVFVFSISVTYMKMGVQVYFLEYNLGNIKLISQLTAVVTALQVAALVVAPILTKKVGKKNVYLIGLIISTGADLVNYAIPPTINTFTIIYCIGMFGIGIQTAISWAMVADVIEYNEWKTGERTEGIIYSTCSFSRKVAQALAGFIPGLVLSLIGYVPNQATQSVEALAGIKQLMFLYPAIFSCVSICVLLFVHNLSEKKYKEILSDLHARKNSEAV